MEEYPPGAEITVLYYLTQFVVGFDPGERHLCGRMPQALDEAIAVGLSGRERLLGQAQPFLDLDNAMTSG
jgi:hypothetical protein